MKKCTGSKLCNRVFCKNFSKDVQCSKCGVWLCKVCDIRVNKKTYCMDCLLTLPFDYIKSLHDEKNKNNAVNTYE